MKYDLLVFRRAGITLRGVDFDSMLASYVLDPSRRSHAIDALAVLAKQHTEAPELIVAAVNELADNPRPANSSALGGSGFRRLLLGYYRALYRVDDESAEVCVLGVGRSDSARWAGRSVIT